MVQLSVVISSNRLDGLFPTSFFKTFSAVMKHIEVSRSIYSLLGFVQFLQYYYQSGLLYRLRALGISTTMDTTVGRIIFQLS